MSPGLTPQSQTEEARARRVRQVRVTAADIEEIKEICLSALQAADIGYAIQHIALREAKLTRGGLIVRGFVKSYSSEYSDKTPRPMRQALEDLGFVVSKDFGKDGIIVTGWDPHHYEGTQLTSHRVRIRVRELQEVEQELLELEASEVQVRGI
ncbi:hypothetical protein [Nocardiopsis sp. NPDC006938]|uniref:hypothetical protein n=1 Tax=Nocardiopsis sp. NPDC006938 TaxID=3364337 RepID=UPI0036A49945